MPFQYVFHSICIFVLMQACSAPAQPIIIKMGAEDGSYEYSELLPKSGEIKGVLFVLPGFSQFANDFYDNSDLPSIAINHDLLVVAAPTQFNLCANRETVERITAILTDVLIRHELEQQPFVFGGFSAGGTILMRYTEMCYENPGDFPVVPSAIFTVDSPIDLISLWEYFEREINRGFSEVGMQEARMVSQMLTKKYGALSDSLHVYQALTPFDMSRNEVGNERFLDRVAVRTYHDVDINWLIQERRRSAIDANFIASSELINRLTQRGNLKAEFIQSDIKGYRKDGRRHPHSWNIVDTKEAIEWMLNTMLIKK